MAVAFLMLTAVSVSGIQAQETDSLRKISGTVTDHSGASLPGVSIIVKGTSTGIVSDMNGKYSLSVPIGVWLVFSYVGMATQERIVIEQIIDVVMDEGVKMEPAKPVDLTIKQSEKVEADNGFAFQMFREVSKVEGSNTFFSPFSLNMALGMLYNGSSGNTRSEMVKTLGLANFSETEINEYYQTMLHALLEIDPSTDMVIANSIWYRNILPVKGSFVKTGKKYFDADVQALDFSNSGAANMINKWCADKTRNRITNIVANPVPNDVMMYLINALYFKSKWDMDKKFDKEKTKLDDFTKTDGEKIKAYLMEQATSLPYYADQHLQCVEMPYGNQAFSMIAILPPEDMNINQLIAYLDHIKLKNAVSSMQQQMVWLKLPRFKIECDFSLNQPLMNLGMKQIFDRKAAKFANIADTVLYVSNIKQKTFVEVNEEGTEAAAVTAITIMAFGRARRTPIEPMRFFADRPFLFLIREKSTGVILFIGRIDEPHE